MTSEGRFLGLENLNENKKNKPIINRQYFNIGLCDFITPKLLKILHIPTIYETIIELFSFKKLMNYFLIIRFKIQEI
jgi:hypothetical protein